MRTLIIQLPLGLPNPATQYAHASVQAGGSAPFQLQWSAIDLLPAAEQHTETVVLLPALTLSWHPVELPPGLHKQPARLLAALQGLLEERLLDEPAQLHMALQPDWQNAARPWVAVCERTWLQAHLQALEGAGLTINRIVPEFNPSTDHLQVTALGDPESGWLWMTHAEHGVWGQPIQSLGPIGQVLNMPPEDLQTAEFRSEPGAVAWASAWSGQAAKMVSPGQHWLGATAAAWDLAQFDFRTHARARYVQRLQRAVGMLWHSHDWRPARWGLVLILVGQLVGLNVWAWKTRSDWQAQQDQWTHLLREAFPNTRVVIDAPLQMAREVERLRQASGQLNANDLEAMLAALGQALPVGITPPGQWTYEPGQLRLKGFKASSADQVTLQKALAQRGYLWRAEGDGGLMTVTPVAQGVKP